MQVSDPFTRRKTQPVLPTHVLKKGEGAVAVKTEDSKEAVKLDKENLKKTEAEEKPVPKPEAAGDLFSAHDFDITIDLG